MTQRNGAGRRCEVDIAFANGNRNRINDDVSGDLDDTGITVGPQDRLEVDGDTTYDTDEHASLTAMHHLGGLMTLEFSTDGALRSHATRLIGDDDPNVDFPAI